MALTVVCAPDSFKESLTAREAGEAMARGVTRVVPDAAVSVVPMADGGEGTVHAVCDALGGELIETDVTGPLGSRVRAHYARAGELAVIESAQACGLDLIDPAARDAMAATTRGVGELIAHAIAGGAKTILIGLGGSATTDGGAGLLQGLGARITTRDGSSIGPGGAGLRDVAAVELPDLGDVTLRVACDVDNPLTGEHGAAAVFGPQKGATPEQVAELDALLADFATLVDDACPTTPGAGAAGGMGFALLALGASLEPGVEIIADAVHLPEKFSGADLVITGEGRIDAQTLHGKTPAGVAKVARAAGAAVLVCAGDVCDEDALAELFDGIIPITSRPCTTEEAMAAAADNLEAAVARAMRLIQLTL